MTTSRWTCDLCYPDSTELGYVGPSLTLIEKNGHWIRSDGQEIRTCWMLIGGHSGEELVTFYHAPRQDPTLDLPGDEFNDLPRKRLMMEYTGGYRKRVTPWRE